VSLPALGRVPEGATTVEQVIRRRLGEGVGGLRGSVEAAAPTVVFVTVWAWRHDLRGALVAAAVPVVVAILLRIVQRQSLRYALSSLAALGIAAFFALRSGKAEDAFLPGILFSCVLLAVTVLSLLGGGPLVGFIGGSATDAPTAWRSHDGVRRLCQRLTLVLAALYAVRVVVMLPLYLAGRVGWLGVTKVALGWPLYLVAVAVMGAVLLRGRTPLDLDEQAASEDSAGERRSSEPLGD
jgi:preprotein translocase subunit SecG